MFEMAGPCTAKLNFKKSKQMLIPKLAIVDLGVHYEPLNSS